MVETTAGRSGLEQVLRIWNELDVPEGLRVVQVTLEGVLMTPAPGPRHRNTVEELHRVLVAALDKTYRVHQTANLLVVEEPGIFVPDFLVMRRGPAPANVPSEDVILAVEVTSPGNPDSDRERKYRAYARGGVQQYLLIDPVPKKVKTATLFTKPVGDEYTKSVRVLYGESLTIEYPAPIVVDTREFPLHDGA